MIQRFPCTYKMYVQGLILRIYVQLTRNEERSELHDEIGKVKSVNLLNLSKFEWFHLRTQGNFLEEISAFFLKVKPDPTNIIKEFVTM